MKKKKQLEIINQIFVRHSNNILALGFVGRIMIEAFRVSEVENNPVLKNLFEESARLLPDHYAKFKDKYPERYKAISFVDSQNLINIISEFEYFLHECLVEILVMHPKKMHKIKIDMEDLIESDNVQLIIRRSASKFLHEEMYKSPNEYLKTIINIISAPSNFLQDLWPTYIEMKARRDLGIHNSWKINDIYKKKIAKSDFDIKDEFLSIDYKYFIEKRLTIFKIMKQIKSQINDKFD